MPVQSFVPVTDLDRAADFYGSLLGLRLISEVPAAVAVFDAGGSPVRVTVVPSHVAAPWTVLGWAVPDIAAMVATMGEAGVSFEQYDNMTDSDGIWTTPGDDRVAWFKDPDGNVLSLTQFAEPENTA